MIRRRVLTWAIVLTVITSIQSQSLPIHSSGLASAALAQGTPEADALTDLAVVALHCAEPPFAEDLAAFFTTGASPLGCSPAVGVGITVTQDAAPLSGSPFATDTAGLLGVSISQGSAVSVQEDPQSLPSGYEPLVGNANGVPYSNPVQLDPVVAGAVALFVNVPSSVAAALRQATPVATPVQGIPEADALTDLVVVALHCAEPPVAEDLATFFATGASPLGCSPAVGAAVTVVQDTEPLSGSPFATDTAGLLGVPIGLGSAVSVQEDPQSLPSGYEPLVGSVNGVPYANPVQLDPVVDGAVALFVNVPSSVAALAQDTPTPEASTPSAPAAAETPASAPTAIPSPSPDSALDRAGCDPAYPDANTCIPPGPPLDPPCAITEERSFTVLPPDPRGLDADRDGIGCEPIA